VLKFLDRQLNLVLLPLLPKALIKTRVLFPCNFPQERRNIFDLYECGLNFVGDALPLSLQLPDLSPHLVRGLLPFQLKPSLCFVGCLLDPFPVLHLF